MSQSLRIRLPDAPDFQAWCVAQREELRTARSPARAGVVRNRLERYALLGMSQGCAVAIVHAVAIRIG